MSFSVGDMFKDCIALRYVRLPPAMERIAERMFSDCTSLTSVTIPGDVEEIEKDAFSGCTSLTDIAFGGTVEQWEALMAKCPDAGIPSFDVSFEPNGHGVAPTGQRATYGTRATEPSVSETGWTCVGWYTDAACTNGWDFSVDTVKADVTLWAKWEQNVVTLDETSLSLDPGETATLTATLAPAGAAGAIAWTSSDPTVAFVSDGTVVGLKAGMAVVTATAGARSASAS
ncbi:MAG: leucine-rich repeat protein [Synergistaceae bacterium]|nr:leucine-rich repeat protein [Synergistaceae bacterium]